MSNIRIIGNKWDEILQEEFQKEYYQNLRKFLKQEYATKVIYPTSKNVYAALRTVDFDDIKVVILGQDPYHEPNQAHGMAFSVNKGVEIPPSLKNIYKELHEDLGIEFPNHGYLMDWAKQGVLLLNTVLTVEEHRANSHANKGWEILTDLIISKLNNKDEPIVFILWGRNARNKKIFITNPKHLVLESAHPSPLSAYNGFFGSKPFSKANNFLIKNSIKPIDWNIK